MDDFISKVIAGIIVFAFFIYLSISAWQNDLGMISAICFAIALSGLFTPLAEQLDKSREKRQEAVRKKYNNPEIVRDEYGEVWDKEFQKVIKNAIDTTTDPSKLSDLQNCQRVAKQMIKDSGSYTLDRPFYKINNAFRLTGCHFTITDSEGKTITQIV